MNGAKPNTDNAKPNTDNKPKEPAAGNDAVDARDLMDDRDKRKPDEEEPGAQPAAKKPGKSPTKTQDEIDADDMNA